DRPRRSRALAASGGPPARPLPVPARRRRVGDRATRTLRSRAMRVRLTPELLAVVAAVVLVVLGVLGFVPGITRHHDQLHVWKAGSRAQLFGVFEVSILLNAVHLATG